MLREGGGAIKLVKGERGGGGGERNSTGEEDGEHGEGRGGGMGKETGKKPIEERI